MTEPIYELGKWQNFTKYQCLFCPYDTLDEAEALAHYEQVHAPRSEQLPPEPPDPSGLVLVADKRGNEVTPAQPQEAGLTPVYDLTPDQVAALVAPAKRRKKQKGA